MSGVSGLYVGELDGWSVGASGFPNDLGRPAHWVFTASNGKRLIAAKADPEIGDRDEAYRSVHAELRRQMVAGK